MADLLNQSYPKTFSAWVKIPKGATADSSILSSYWTETVVTSTLQHGFIFAVDKSGAPYFFFCSANSSGTHKMAGPLKFTKYADVSAVNVENGEWTNVSMIIDNETKTARCYVNGVECYYYTKSAISNPVTVSWVYKEETFAKELVLGGDYRDANSNYCKGSIRELVVYDEVLTEDQVKSIYNNGAASIDVAPMAHYKPDTANSHTTVKDISGNGHHFYYADDDVTVSFDANGGSGTMETVSGFVPGDSYALPACTFTPPSGKCFSGWALSADGDVLTDTEISLIGDTVLYAVWEDIVYPGEGMIFTKEPYYVLEEMLSDIPYTYYAHIYIPEGLEKVSAGSILSSWFDNIDPSVNFYVDVDGTPGFTYRVASGSTNNTYVKFNAGSVPYGEWVRMAVTVADNGEGEMKVVKCCVNGTVLSQKVLKNNYDEHATQNPFVLGGNAAPGNTGVFKGEIK